MRNSSLLSALAASFAIVNINGQAVFNPADNTFTCAKPFAAYCAGDSLKTNIIIRCTGDKQGFPGNCNDNLAGVPPVGVKTFAPCYQSSSIAGDAACSFDGIVYGPNGTFPVPGSSATASSSSPTTTTRAYTVPPYPIARDVIPAAGPTGTVVVGTAAGTGTGAAGGGAATDTGAPISGSAPEMGKVDKVALGGAVMAIIGVML